MRTKIVIFAAVLLALGAGVRVAEQGRPEVAMARAAESFLATLDAAQKAKLCGG